MPDHSVDGSERRALLWWALALATTWLVLGAMHYSTRDADSRLYSEIAARMSSTPVSRWIAPDFPPGWFMSGAFREHPAGFFILPALLARMGYPAEQAGYAIGAFYVAGAILLLQRLAGAVVPSHDARVLGWALQLIPIAFTYRIRANHEQAVLFFLVLALLGLELARRHVAFVALTVTGLVALLLVKGLFALFGLAVCALWLICLGVVAPRRETIEWRPWIGLALAFLAMAASALLYEHLYRATTGQPFWSVYASRQLGVAGAAQSASLPNVMWYLGRVAWFPFPCSLALVALGIAMMRQRIAGASSAAPDDPAARAGLVFAVATTVLYVGLFSLSARRADRYIFPAYYAVGAAGAIASVRACPPLMRLARSLDRPWLAPSVFAVTIAAHILAGWAGLPPVKL